MARSPFSANWYRVADFVPRLRSHTEIHRQRFRGETWYILQDRQSGRFHRISPTANLMLCLMDGRRTVREIWEAVSARSGDDPPTQDQTIELLAQLHASDLLAGEMPPDIGELAHRGSEQERKALMQKLRNPLALRLPLFDPDKFLDATLPIVRPLFTVVGFVVWLGLVVAGLVLAALNWDTLTADVVTQALSAQNLLVLALVYPVIKFLHELGHAYSTKAWGGEVHEFGFMLLVMIPVPYVDASASAAFREKWRRMVVSGAGIMVELAAAAIAMIVWINAEPGLLRAVAFNVMLIGSVSTLVFNGNPLLRFDGYYIFSDLVEIPNLASRGNRYFFHVIQRRLFGMEDSESPATHDSERPWLFWYAVLAAIYRVVVSLGIASFIATQLFFLGVLIAIWTLATSFLAPIGKGLMFLVSGPKLRGHRRRAILVTGGVAAALLGFLFALPLPYSTVAQGIVWVPEEAVVRSGTDGVVRAVAGHEDAAVVAGAPILELDDPILDAQVAVLKAQQAEYALRLDAVRALDPVQRNLIEGQLAHIEGRLAAYAARRGELTVRATTAGRLVMPVNADVEGRYVRRGDLVAYVVAPGDPMLRVVVPQAEIDLVRSRVGPVEVRFAEAIDHIRPARILRETPAAQLNVPSLALTTEGGGEIVLDPTDAQRSRALEGLFVVDLAILDGAPVERLGGRVYVRFDHGAEPLAFRFLRTLRQVFLRRFEV